MGMSGVFWYFWGSLGCFSGTLGYFRGTLWYVGYTSGYILYLLFHFITYHYKAMHRS